MKTTRRIAFGTAAAILLVLAGPAVFSDTIALHSISREAFDAEAIALGQWNGDSTFAIEKVYYGPLKEGETIVVTGQSYCRMTEEGPKRYSVTLPEAEPYYRSEKDYYLCLQGKAEKRFTSSTRTILFLVTKAAGESPDAAGKWKPNNRYSSVRRIEDGRTLIYRQFSDPGPCILAYDEKRPLLGDIEAAIKEAVSKKESYFDAAALAVPEKKAAALVKYLDPDEERHYRKAALIDLVATGPAAGPHLRAMLIGETDRNRRYEYFHAIGDCGDSSSERFLLELLRENRLLIEKIPASRADVPRELREAAAERLSIVYALGRVATKASEAALLSEIEAGIGGDESLVADALRGFANFPSEENLPLIVHVLKYYQLPTRGYVLNTAVEVLAKHRFRGAARLLLKIACGSSALAANDAAKAFAEMTAIGYPNWDSTRACGWYFKQPDEKTVLSEIKEGMAFQNARNITDLRARTIALLEVHTEGGDSWSQRAAALLFGRDAEPDIDGIKDFIKSAPTELRCKILLTIGVSKNHRWDAYLLALLDSSRKNLPVVPDLRSTADENLPDNIRERLAICRALAKIGGEKAVAALRAEYETHLGKGDYRIRDLAISGFSNTRLRENIPAMVKAYEFYLDPAYGREGVLERKDVIAVLVVYREVPEAIPVLMRCLDDPDEDNRQFVEFALFFATGKGEREWTGDDWRKWWEEHKDEYEAEDNTEK